VPILSHDAKAVLGYFAFDLNTLKLSHDKYNICKETTGSKV